MTGPENQPAFLLGALVLSHTASIQDQRAVVCDGRAISYGVIATRARACAGRIQAFGLQPGGSQSVGVLAANSLDYAVIVIGCQLAGVPIVPLPVLIAPDAQGRMVAEAKVALLFHDDDHAAAARAIVNQLGDGAAPTLVPIGLPGPAAVISQALDTWLSAGDRSYTPVELDADWVSDLIYSSGTTGVPKGIVQTYGSRKALCISLSALGALEHVALLNTIGLYSNFGLSALLLTIWWGGTFFMERKFSAPAIVEVLRQENIGMAWFAPATLVRTLDAPGFLEAARGKPCSKLCAGAPFSTAQKQRVLGEWPGPFFEVYGQTETGTLTLFAMHTAPPGKLGSVGKVLPTVSIRIIDAVGQVVPDGQEGEIVGRSTTLMSGYHQQEAASTSADWTDGLGNRYVRTGDIGRLDDDGFLWLCGRTKEMIISGGYNVYPADIERVALDHPSVLEVAVVGFESARWGETPIAFVSLREGAEAEEEDIRTWINSRVGAVQRVAAVKILSELPSGAMGKILKRELRTRFSGMFGVFA